MGSRGSWQEADELCLNADNWTLKLAEKKAAAKEVR